MANMLLRNRNHSDSGFMNMVNSIKTAGPSGAVFDNMYKNNPEFRRFADSVRNKSPEEAFKQHGLDFNKFKGLKW